VRIATYTRIIRYLTELNKLELKLGFVSRSKTDLGLTRFRRGLQSSAGHTEAQITS